MKVLQINSVCGYGSTGRIATDIYKILEENGHECLIAYGRGISPDGINSIKIGTTVDNYMHVVESRLFDNHGFASKKATKGFLAKVKEYDPDIIHLHNIHGYYINIELLFDYLKEVKKPVVWTLHDCWAFTGHCAYFDYVGCDKWRNGCHDCLQKNKYPQSLLLDNSRCNYKKKKGLFIGVQNMIIVTPSKWLANLVNQSFLKNYDVKVINNGINLDVFKPTASDFRQQYNLNDKFVILGVASVWDDRKGFKYFLKLSKRLGVEYKIVLVGLNNKQRRQLPQNSIGIKRTNNVEELAKIYSSADVFLNPTLEDNFPTTNLEALACGTPVITFNTGGSGECMGRGCGIINIKGSLEGLVSNLEIIKDRGKSSYSVQCVERAKLYNRKNKFNEYLAVYKYL